MGTVVRFPAPWLGAPPPPRRRLATALSPFYTRATVSQTNQAILPTGAPFRLGDWLVEPTLNRIRRGGELLQLELKAMDVLLCLASRPGELVTKRELVDAVWQTEFVSDNTLTRRVAELRDALRDDARHPRYIETVPKRGYRLIAAVGDLESEAPGPYKLEPDRTELERCPYPGLASFTEDDAEEFFGREAETAALWRKISSRRLLAVVGPSGVGKSSLLKAGVIPRAPPGWRAIALTPGAAPLLSLAQALAPDFAGEVDEVQHLLGFQDSDVALGLVARWRGRFAEALVVVDQFEELFTLNPPEAQGSFIVLLRRLVDAADVHLVLVLRDDFLVRCHHHPQLAPIFSDLTPVAPPSDQDLRRALVEPAARRGFRFSSELLVDEMLDAVASERGALPLLAFAVSRLWELRDLERRLLTREAYERIGGVTGALAQHAEATVEAIGEGRLAVVRELLRNLVTAHGTRAVRPADDLLSVFADRHHEPTAEVLEALIRARLLVSFEEQMPADGQPRSRRRVEIVHESLLTAWPRLVRWQTQDADGAQLRDQLRQAAQLWHERGQPRELLWTGASYRELKLWRERYPGRLSDTEQAFTAATVRHARRRRRQGRAMLAAAVTVAFAVAGVTTTLWRRSELGARLAEARRLHTMARARLDTSPPAAFAAAIASLELADEPEVRRLLLEVLTRGPLPRVAVMTGEEPYVTDVDITPDGRWLALGRFDGSAMLFAADGRQVARWRVVGDQAPDEGPVVVRGLRGSTVLATGFPFEPTVRFWSIPDGRPLGLTPVQAAEEQPGVDPVNAATARRLFRAGEVRRDEDRWVMDFSARALLLELAGTTWVPADADPARHRLVYARGTDLWAADLRQGLEQRPVRLAGHETGFEQIALDPTGDRFATVDTSGRLELWQLETEQARVVRARSVGENRRARELRFSPSGKLIAAGFNEGPWLLWDLEGPPDAEPLSVPGVFDAYVGMDLDTEERWLATAALTGAALWKLDDRSSPYLLRGHTAGVTAVAFGGDGSWLVSASADGTVRWWPLRASAGLRSRVLLDWGHPVEAQFLKLVVDPGGQLVAVSAGLDGVRVVPVDGGQPRALHGFAGAVHALAVGPRGRLVAAGGGIYSPADAVVRVWDLETGGVTTLDAGDGSPVASVQFAPEGNLLSSSGGNLRLWDLATGVHRVVGHGVETVVSPDGRLALSRSGGWSPSAEENRPADLVLHDLTRGTSGGLPSHGAIASGMAFDPTGTVVVTTGPGGDIRVGPVTGEAPHLLLGMPGSNHYLAVAVSPDGRWIASSSGNDTVIRLWPMPELTEPPLHTLPHDQLLARLKGMTNLRFAPDDPGRSGYHLEVDPFPGWE
jgi:WD40 repeat protein/DNA-binding winged helix-turn-helix (wHTH) protein